MARKVDIKSLPVLDVKNEYDPFNLPFLKKEDNKVFNGEFDVTNAPKKLVGVPTGNEEIKLTDYLVNRPIPKEIIQWQNIPNFHPDSLDMENWYTPLSNYMYDGVWVDGEYYNPFFIYWMNMFIFPIPVYDEDGNPTEEFDFGHPVYCNIDRYFFDYCWKAELLREDAAIMGGRGIGKSFEINSILDREYRLFPNSISLVSSTNEDTTNEAWTKIQDGIELIEKKHRAWKLKRLEDSSTTIRSGELKDLPDGTTDEVGHLSKFEKVIYGKNPGKTRGKRPTKQLIEEFAAFPPSTQKGSLGACRRESRGSWYVMGSIKKCTVFYSGTGGTVENDEAEGIFTNPEAHGILATEDWGIKSGFFVPTQIKRAGTWEKTGCPDITRATNEVEAERSAIRTDPKALLSLQQEYPMNLKEVFIRRGINNFNQDLISTQRTNLKFEKNLKPERGFLKWILAENGRPVGVEWDSSLNGDIEILEHPHWLTEHALEDEKEPIDNLYVSGIDGIDQGLMDSSYAQDDQKGSKLAMLVKKRILNGAYMRTTSNIYVAKYLKRSNDVRRDWDNALKLTIYYNALANLEYTKIGIVGHFREKGYYHFLKKRPTINLSGANFTKATNLIGTTTATEVINHQDQKIGAYIEDFYDQILFEDLLEQLQDYNREDRTKFDLVIAMGLCELADEDLQFSARPKLPPITENLQSFGYYTETLPDGRKIKKYGIIPNSNNYKDEISESLRKEAENYRKSGGVRWIDNSDPTNPIYHYD